jgi:hypothetical protein
MMATLRRESAALFRLSSATWNISYIPAQNHSNQLFPAESLSIPTRNS